MRVGCAQLAAKSMDRAADAWPIMEAMVDRAASQGVDLLILPEVAYPSYWLESRERYFRDDVLRSADVLDRYARLAARYRIWLTAGYVEESGDQLFNSAAIFDRAGSHVAVARKQFLWDCDHDWFTPGGEPCIVETEFGMMGVLICADLRMPEIMATLAQSGAAFVVQPTAWVNAALTEGGYRNIQPEFLVQARTMEFAVPMASCSKSGREICPMGYVGQSRIVDRAGATLASAEIEGDELVTAEIHPARATCPRISPAMLSRLVSDQPPFESVRREFTCSIDVRQGAEAIVSRLSKDGVRVAALESADLFSFAPARCAALDGVQVIVANRTLDAGWMALACARAAENRIFVVAASRVSVHAVIEPGGRVLWRECDSTAAIDLNIAEADRKTFTPKTGIWSQRRPETYRLAP